MAIFKNNQEFVNKLYFVTFHGSITSVLNNTLLHYVTIMWHTSDLMLQMQLATFLQLIDFI